jgi:hypothetical protein
MDINNLVSFEDDDFIPVKMNVNKSSKSYYDEPNKEINSDNNSDGKTDDSKSSSNDSLIGEIIEPNISNQVSITDDFDSDKFAKTIVDSINLGNEEVETINKDKVIRYIPITRKDGQNMYITMKNMKNQLYVKKKIINYPSGKKFEQNVICVKPDWETVNNVENETEQDSQNKLDNLKKIFIVESFNKIKRNLTDKIKGYIKIPDYEDQLSYNLAIRSRNDKLYSVVYHNDKIYSFERMLFNHILRDCMQNYIILIDGLRITNNHVSLVMRFCRSVIPDEITSQLKYHDTQIAISKVINYKNTKYINKLKYGGNINLKNKYVNKSDIISKLTYHIDNN